MSYFRDLDLDLRLQGFEKSANKVRNCACGGRLSIVRYIHPSKAEAICVNPSCPNYNQTVTVRLTRSVR
jgi:hypothetical protein